jgi:hypothetical protein
MFMPAAKGSTHSARTETEESMKLGPSIVRWVMGPGAFSPSPHIMRSVLLGLFSLGHFFSHFYDTTLDFCKIVIPGSRKNIKLIKVPEDHALF